MRITTWNVNGLRAAIRKGFAKYVDFLQPDVLLLQEVRALPEQLPAEWQEPEGWSVYWNPAKKKGYSGTAVLAREPFVVADIGLGPRDSDDDGRVIEVSMGRLRIATVYLPSGASSAGRQEQKERWMRRFRLWATRRLQHDGPFIVGGDLNIARTERDLFYAKSNEMTSGFLPHERQWMNRLVASGWHDFVREHAGDVDGPYSWWSNRGRARELDRGWRIDYLLGNTRAAELFRSAHTHRKAALEASDHAPVSIDLDL